MESFNGKLRDELLNTEVFNTLAEARVLIEQWRRHYNTVRPHSSLGYRPPAPEVKLVPPLMLPDLPKPTGSAPTQTRHALTFRPDHPVGAGHTVLTDNGVQFIHNLPDRSTPEEEAAIDAYWAARGEPRIYLVHAFNHACPQLGVEHRTTKPYHPWTNG